MARSSLVFVLAAVGLAGCTPKAPPSDPSGLSRAQLADVRRELFAALTPITLANCTLRRYGDERDGGYLLCENLMGEATAAYSYGIDGRDQWGCDVSQQLRTSVHEYDCFNLKRPLCATGSLVFHEECVGDVKKTVEGRPYDTVWSQLARNGDAEKHLILKMDVEGDEWASLLAAPDSMFDRIDQLAIELHGTDKATFVATAQNLARFFYVVHFHANNNACTPGIGPFTSWANEVLLVNKRIGLPDPSREKPTLPSPLDHPNQARRKDCQPIF